MRSLTVFSPLPQHAVLKRYAVALASVALALGLRAALEPVLGHVGNYITVYIAVVFSALVCGLGPSILSAVVGTAGVVFWFIAPLHTVSTTDRIHSLIAWILVCPILIALG